MAWEDFLAGFSRFGLLGVGGRGGGILEGNLGLKG